MNLGHKNKISQAALDAFLHLCHVRSYPAKLTIVRPGDIGDRLLFVVDGSVSVSVEDDDGHELILAYLNKHDFVGEIGVFKNAEKRSAFVKTRTSCKMAEIGYDRFKALLNGDLHEHAVEILTVLGEQLSTRLLITSRKYRCVSTPPTAR
jgi:CRP/FNR family cyclic AMP-dependent transcriptional regulator